MTVGRVDGSDLFRSGLVQAVSALDHYIHGVALDRAVDIMLGRLPPGATTKVGLPLHAVREIAASTSQVALELAARTHMAQRLALETYQQPDDIAKSLAMVGVPKIWSRAFPESSSSITTALSLIVRRRNRIVHECDADPLNPGHVTSLSDVDALYSIATVERLAIAVDLLC